MWISNIILLAVVVASSADTIDDIEKSILGNWDIYGTTTEVPQIKDTSDDYTDTIEKDILKDWEKYATNKTSTSTTAEVPHIKECEIDSGEVGKCVKKSLCSGTPTDDPVTAFTIRSLPSFGFHSKRDDSREGQCEWMEVCCPASNVISPTTKPPPTPLGCGYSNAGGLRGIDGKATTAEYADFPWMVALMVKKNMPSAKFTDEYIGGGTIIHPSVVMTVAHKVASIRDPETLKCRAGEWNWEINNEQDVYQEREVARIIVHEQFNKVHIHYDIALLKLKSAFDLTNAPHIGVACLEKTLPPAGTICYSMGWGKDKTKNVDNAKILKKLTLPLVAGDVCEQRLWPKLTRRYKLHKTLTCAGGEVGVDTCDGDGGSPLVCPIHDKLRMRYSVVGMVAYGLDCGTNFPGVYAKVPVMYDWVAKQMTMTLKIEPTTYVY